ncbi:hypothetical protein CCAN11_2330012 [Capnocytophaga canimorsus]|uniref:Uncharacterized protein n=1 Tax=Capnocytophaga canimorsus TaxID=28188 RepID=A0A0B7INM6_9FLAO|nr:hypothetical protein CCAN11_2330012 [Capnocytophaga canimorsus]
MALSALILTGVFIYTARKLSFIHPVKKERIEIQAPIPNDVLWQSAYNQLNGEL